MSNGVSNSDEGGCDNWAAFFENKTERKRNLALARRYLGDTYEAEDVLQDASICVFPHADIEDKPKYFRMTVRNKCIDKLTDRSRLMIIKALPLIGPSNDESEEVAMPVPDPGFNPEENEERKEENNRLHRIVEDCSQKLTVREKALLDLHLKGETKQEIATAFGENVKQIRVEINALMTKMRYRCKRDNKKQGGQ